MLPSTVVRLTAKVLAAAPAVASATVAATLATALMGDTAGAGVVLGEPPDSEITITGEIDGLYPGAVVTLDARVTNPRDVPIEVTSLVVAVSDASDACPATMLHVGAMTATVEVAPRSGAVVPVEVRMDKTANDACQGVSWPLEFAALAVGPDGEVMTATEPGGPDALPSGDPAAENYPAAGIGALVTATLAGTCLLARRAIKHHHAAST